VACWMNPPPLDITSVGVMLYHR